MGRCGADRGWVLVGRELEVAAARGGAAPPLEPARWAREGGRPLQLPLEEPAAGLLVLLPAGDRGVLALEAAAGPVPLAVLSEIAALIAPLAALPLAQGAV
jgi:hypothetical protein